MLISFYNPESQAACPKCGFVKCYNLGGNLAYGEKYLDFLHMDCGTEWRIYLGGRGTVSPIPKPFIPGRRDPSVGEVD